MAFYGTDPKNIDHIVISTPPCQTDFLNHYTAYLIGQLILEKRGEFFDPRDIIHIGGPGPMIYGARGLLVNDLAAFLTGRAHALSLCETEKAALREVAVNRALAVYGNQDTREATMYIEKLYSSFLRNIREDLPEQVVVIDITQSQQYKIDAVHTLLQNGRHYKLMVVLRDIVSIERLGGNLEPRFRLCFDLFVDLPADSFDDRSSQSPIIRFSSASRDRNPSNTILGKFFSRLPYIPPRANENYTSTTVPSLTNESNQFVHELPAMQ